MFQRNAEQALTTPFDMYETFKDILLRVNKPPVHKADVNGTLPRGELGWKNKFFSFKLFLLNGGRIMQVLTVERLIVMYARNINRHTKRHSATCVHFVILGSF